MRYEMMRPGQIQDAIRRRLPLLMPVGVLEYHGHQNPVGTDALIAQGIVHRIEARTECVVAPTVFYGYTGEWAADERLGEIHIDGDALYAFAKPILKAFLGQGWPSIYVICHHQGPQGVTMLTYQRAATEAAFECAREQAGPGWFRQANWHDDDNRLAEIAFHTFHVVGDAAYSTEGYPGHGGCGETSAMLFLYPETVDLGELAGMDPRPYWAKDAEESSEECGRRIGEAIIDSWVARLAADRQPGA